MKGISPIVSVTLLIALAVIVGVSIYFWAAGLATEPQVPTAQVVDISVTAIDVSAGEYLVTNVDTESFTAVGLNTSTGTDCMFTASTTIGPGESDNCTISTAPTGEIVFFYDNVGPATVVVG